MILTNKIRVGSLFSGAGAFEYAIKKCGLDFSTIFACDNGEIEIEIDYEVEFKKIKNMELISDQRDYANNIYLSSTRKRNYMKEIYCANNEVDNNNFFYDVKLLDGTKFKNKIDILVGGSPCQSFSTVGKQRGLEDTRGTLFYEYARILKETQPKYFIYENVKGLLTHDKGNTWEIICATFSDLGYYFKYSILNSKDYGVPQNRNRVFVVGFKNKKDYDDFSFPKKETLKYKMHDFLESKTPIGKFHNDNGILKLQSSNKLQEVDKRYFLTPGVEKYVMSTGTKNWHQKPIIDLNIARPLLKTMANHHRAGTDNYVKEFNKIRMLTEREAFRLQGFGDDYIINISPARAYRVAGNSITTNILSKIFKNIWK